MKRLLIPVLAALLFAAPTGAIAADLVIRNIDFSIGIQAGRTYREPPPQVVYVVQEEPRHRGHHKHWKKEHRRHHRSEPQVVVIGPDRRSGCDNHNPVVVTRTGSVVVVADGRR